MPKVKPSRSSQVKEKRDKEIASFWETKVGGRKWCRACKGSASARNDTARKTVNTV